MITKQTTDNTLVDYPRLDKLIEFFSQTQDLPGDFAEVGVYKGGTAYLLAQMATQCHKRLFLFDTFHGMPPVDASKDLHHEGDFNDTSLKHVANLLEPFINVAMYQGIFPKYNLEYVEFRKFSLVHLDVDIYPSVKECLEFFAPRMTPGGIIVLDDYLEPNCPGAKLAADDFVEKNGYTVVPTVQSQAIIRF
jgi:O-methyltransferase